jgi:hypothetical protein
MRVEDVYSQNRRLWVRLNEKGGKQHGMACHHNLETYPARIYRRRGPRERSESAVVSDPRPRDRPAHGEPPAPGERPREPRGWPGQARPPSPARGSQEGGRVHDLRGRVFPTSSRATSVRTGNSRCRSVMAGARPRRPTRAGSGNSRICPLPGWHRLSPYGARCAG